MNTDSADLIRLYRWMRTARRIDEVERDLLARGEGFFHVGAAGHEATAAFALFLQADDCLHCHYRDKALLHARGIPIVEYFDSLLGSARGHSAGRQMSAHLSAPALNVLSMVGPVGNNALQAAGIAHEVKHRRSRPIVLCSLGDGTTQQGEVLEAIAETVRWQLPVLFLIEDNRYSISSRTGGKTFYSTPQGDASSFYGMPIHRADGTNVLTCIPVFRDLVNEVRGSRAPGLCVMQTERLTDHTNADDELVYREKGEIERLRGSADPVARLRADLSALGVSEREIATAEQHVESEIATAVDAALDAPAPVVSVDAKTPLPQALMDRRREYRGSEGGDRLTMSAALRESLRGRMASDMRVTLYGEDIEDPKGDVFGVTRGLTTAFPGRVTNAPLSESTIVGTSIGRALAGGRPVAFIQFADFLPLAFNQLATELASMAWRTCDGWKAPVIVMATCGGYRPGLGPFHAGSHESIVAHLPGLDVAIPSTAADAAGILNASFAGERPTVVFYPKALLNDAERSTSSDIAHHFIPIGCARVVRQGRDLTMVAWGNTVPICEKVASALEDTGVEAEVIDLRWLSPWDRAAVCASTAKTRRILVVHEDNATGGFGAEVIATVSESVPGVESRRVARPDTFVPCHFGNQLAVLPSYGSVLTIAAEMCGFDVNWKPESQPDARTQVVTALGPSPSDHSVEVVELLAELGDAVKAGQVLASLESDKALVDVAAPVDGIVDSVHAQVGMRIDVNQPLLTLRVARRRERQPSREAIVASSFKRRPDSRRNARGEGVAHVMLAGLATVRGRARLHNDELLTRLPTLRANGNGTDGIFERTGIECRVVADGTQDAISMAVEASTAALAEAGIGAHELDLVICSTSTPTMISPSTACQVLHRMAPSCEVAAYDLQAACSGYIYGLAAAWDRIQAHREAKVLLITTETMRRIVDIDDPDTSPIFADAATATVLTDAGADQAGLAVLQRPLISARGEDGTTIRVPLPEAGAYVHMDGKRIFAEAVRRMHSTLEQACARSKLTVADLDVIVPHQANGRIIEAMRARLKLPKDRVWNEIRYQGNTSSSSIPLALATLIRSDKSCERIGVCAFGAGYTFGAAILLRGDAAVRGGSAAPARNPQ